MCWKSVVTSALKMGSRGLGKSTPGGAKMTPRGWNFVPRGVPNGFPEASGGLLGARWASGGRRPADGRPTEGSWSRLGAVLGPSWRLLGPFWPPPGEARGGSGRSFLKVFWDVRRGSQKSEHVCIVFLFLGVYFYAICCPLLPSLLRARRRREHGKILKINWFLWVASHLRLFRATREKT